MLCGVDNESQSMEMCGNCYSYVQIKRREEMNVDANLARW